MENNHTFVICAYGDSPYLEECNSWNQDGNYDRVSAMGMLMILREDRFKRIKSAKANQNKTIKNIKDDNFISYIFEYFSSNSKEGCFLLFSISER